MLDASDLAELQLDNNCDQIIIAINYTLKSINNDVTACFAAGHAQWTMAR